MKFIRTIIAFLLVYSFVAVLVVLAVVAYWLRGFSPDIQPQTIAKISVTELDKQYGAGYVYFKNDTANALEVMVTRDTSSATTNNEAVLAARSSVMIATYTKITLPDYLVPLGFRSMYKLKSISDASGKVVYQKDDQIYQILTAVGVIKHDASSLLKFENITVPLVASSTPITYTITVDDSGLHENIEK